jgi:FkbM family methyltransferase
MDEFIELRKGWWWPKKDKACWNYLTKRPNLPELISKYVDNKNTVLQAGGNAGMYPKFYENIFSKVISFEPDPTNYLCLEKNTSEKTLKYNYCLSDREEHVNLSYDEIDIRKPNLGNLSVKGKGNIQAITIDSLKLSVCDLIHLDVEGYEGKVLTGAIETIRKLKPVIALEMKGHGERYGWSDDRLNSFLNSLGYKEVDNIFDDSVFMPWET